MPGCLVSAPSVNQARAVYLRTSASTPGKGERDGSERVDMVLSASKIEHMPEAGKYGDGNGCSGNLG